MAKEMDLPVNIHSRDAAQDTFDLMKKEHAGTTGGVIHCFSSSAQMALEYVKLGYFIGIGGVVTFKNARVMKEVAAAVPLEQMDIGKLREALRGTTDTDIARFLQLMQASGLGKGGGKA